MTTTPELLVSREHMQAQTEAKRERGGGGEEKKACLPLTSTPTAIIVFEMSLDQKEKKQVHWNAG